MNKQTNAMFIILLGFLAAYVVRFGFTPVPQNYLVALLFTLTFSSIMLPATGAFRHEFRWAFLRKTRRLLAGWALVVTALVAVAAMFKVTSDYSRIWFGYWVIFGGIGLFAGQIIEHGWQIRRKGQVKSARRVVLAGGGDNGKRVEKRILNDPDGSLNLVARFGTDWAGENVLPIERLAAFVESEKINEVWIAAPWEDKALLESALNALAELVVDINVIPDLHQYRLLNQSIAEWDGLPVISLSGMPMTAIEKRLKSIFDRLVSFLLILVLSPLLLCIALLVKFSGPGPVLFRQKRHGIGGESIDIFKFRSLNDEEKLSGEVDQVTLEDQRVTTIGRILRRSSLDELPQLFNVVLGEMSLVGPRPHPIELNDAFKSRIPRYMLRHKVKPGITGWAQVNGYRGITDTDDKMALRIEHDLWYIQNWSLWLDLKILLQTPLAMIHRNAF